MGNDPTISYVGIRGDEDRDGYISHKENIQSIFPFRKNIWSKEIVNQILINKNLDLLEDISVAVIQGEKKDAFIKIIKEKLSFEYDLDRKLKDLLTVSISNFNKVTFEFLKTTDYPIGLIEDFPMLENEDVLVRDDIFRILSPEHQAGYRGRGGAGLTGDAARAGRISPPGLIGAPRTGVGAGSLGNPEPGWLPHLPDAAGIPAVASLDSLDWKAYLVAMPHE